MIISHKLKCIFFAIPKTATHAIRIALRPHLDEGDEEQVGLFVKKKYSDPDIAKISHGHITCQQLKAVLEPEIWDSYYKFIFVRNPFDKLVSYCAFMNKNNPDFHETPQAYMYNALMSRKTSKHILFQPQADFVNDENGESMVDFVGQFEDLQGGYDHICKHLGIESAPLEEVNGSKHKDYKEYYNEELVEMTAAKYKVDFESFNYPKNI